jgi:hypothetical protein
MGRTKLSKGLADDASKVQWRKPEELKSDFGVDFQPGTVSLSIIAYRQRMI